jgi:hypothetical protein
LTPSDPHIRPADPLAYDKRCVSLAPEVVAIIEAWQTRTGEPHFSATLSRLVEAGDGNLRLYRHKLSQPLNVLALLSHELPDAEARAQAKRAVEQARRLLEVRT